MGSFRFDSLRMITVGLVAASGFLPGFGGTVSADESTGGLTTHVVAATGSAIAGGYEAAPALMLCVALALSFPLLVFGGRILRAIGPRPDVTRRYKPGKADEAIVMMEGESLEAPPHAFLEMEGAGQHRFAIGRDMLRIGREDDNDIRIPSGAVHRYHAAIHREDSDGWHITDLSGFDGNGIIVNGQRCSDARLADGDIIQLGPGRLRFRAGYV